MRAANTLTRRNGVTLLEALVAIFVMAIGLLALLTLFPLGALRMAKAIQDDACSQLGANARSIAVFKKVPWDTSVVPSFPSPGGNLVPQPAHPDYPSYPVLVDPIGYYSCGGAGGLAGATNLCGGFSWVGRTTASFVAAPPATDSLQWFTRQDDIIFENALPNQGNGPPGLPQLLLPPPNPASFSRDTRYSYALQCQLPRSSDSMVVDVTVVVYSKRSVTPTPLVGAGLPGNISLPEYSYVNSSYFDTSRNTITINYGVGGTPPPPVVIGDWVMDNTYFPLAGGANGMAHGGWYRIVGMTDLGNNLLELELETPLRGFPLVNPAPPPNTNNTTWLGTAIILDGVAEVYTFGTIRMQ